MIPATLKACSRVGIVISSVGRLGVKLLTLGGRYDALAEAAYTLVRFKDP